jgi:hypothetical protein
VIAQVLGVTDILQLGVDVDCDCRLFGGLGQVLDGVLGLLAPFFTTVVQAIGSRSTPPSWRSLTKELVVRSTD